MQVSAEYRGVRSPAAGLQAVVNHLMWVLGTELAGPQEEQYVLLTLELFHWPLLTFACFFVRFKDVSLSCPSWP